MLEPLVKSWVEGVNEQSCEMNMIARPHGPGARAWLHVFAENSTETCLADCICSSLTSRLSNSTHDTSCKISEWSDPAMSQAQRAELSIACISMRSPKGSEPKMELSEENDTLVQTASESKVRGPRHAGVAKQQLAGQETTPRTTRPPNCATTT